VSQHERMVEELAGYALGALAPEEAAALEGHLRSCERCRAELAWLRPAVEVLSASVEPREPPGRLRRRVLEQARAEASAQGGRLRWRRIGALRPAYALAALAASVLVAGVAGYELRGSGPQATTTPARVTGLASPGTRGALVRFGDWGTLELSGLPPLRRGRVYEAWVSSGGRVRPAGVFEPSPAGAAAAGVTGLADADAVMVTVEPRGGRSQPSSPPILVAPVS